MFSLHITGWSLSPNKNKTSRQPLFFSDFSDLVQCRFVLLWYYQSLALGRFAILYYFLFFSICGLTKVYHSSILFGVFRRHLICIILNKDIFMIWIFQIMNFVRLQSLQNYWFLSWSLDLYLAMDIRLTFFDVILNFIHN